MNEDWHSRLAQSLTRRPLLWPMGAGLFVRVLTAVWGLSFHARDDYFHVLQPALRWIADPSFDWEHSGLPGAGIRSHLVPRLVEGLVLFAHSVGIDSPDGVLRLIYTVFGLYSLAVVPAVYLLARRLLDGRSVLIATWLAAVHFAMPYAGTRLLIEALAMPPLALGVYFATFATSGALLLAGLFVGLACWFRFQVGAAALGLAVAVFWAGKKEGGLGGGTRRVLALAAGGAVALLAQGLFDLWTTGGFLRPLLNNIAVNLHPPAELSRSGAFAYIGLWLLFTAPPASLLAVPAMARSARKLAVVVWPFAVFVLLHSLVPHKEERFMLPVLPLFLVWLAAVPHTLLEATGKLSRWLVRWRRPAFVWAIALHTLGLLLVLNNQSQGNLREAMLTLRSDRTARALVSFGPEVQSYFLGNQTLPNERSSHADVLWLARTLRLLAEAGTPANRFIAFLPDRPQAEALLSRSGLLCDAPQELNGWWFDRLLYALNPKRNKRRAPVLLWRCEQPAFASAAEVDKPRHQTVRCHTASWL